MAISKKQAKQEERAMPEIERKLHDKAKKNNHVCLNIILRDSIRQIKCYNKVIERIAENKFIKHIRTIFVDYTKFCPSYSTVKDALTRHYEECSCSHHWFFETEAVCMSPISTSEGSSLLILNMLDI